MMEIKLSGYIEHLQEMGQVCMNNLPFGAIRKIQKKLVNKGYETVYDQNQDKLRLLK